MKTLPIESEKRTVVAEAQTGLPDDSLTLESAQEQYKKLQSFIKSQMRVGRDFGIIPGCKKPSLWKPGAEKLLNFHGLGCRLEASSGTVVDWNAPFFNYEYRAVAFRQRTGASVAESFGSCNSKEDKYRYNWVYENKVPRGLKKEDLEWKEKDARGGGKYKVYRIENNDLYSLVNTLQKMAQKRALIGTALIACRASDSFTMDLDEEEAPKVAEGPASANPPPSGSNVAVISKKDWTDLVDAAKRLNIPEPNLKTYIANKFDYITVKDAENGDFPDFAKLRVADLPVVLKWIKGGS